LLVSHQANTGCFDHVLDMKQSWIETKLKLKQSWIENKVELKTKLNWKQSWI
jgi:hypothetical protein